MIILGLWVITVIKALYVKILLTKYYVHRKQFYFQMAPNFGVTIRTCMLLKDSSSIKKYQLIGGRQGWDVIWKVDYFSNYMHVPFPQLVRQRRKLGVLWSYYAPFVSFNRNTTSIIWHYLMEASRENFAHSRRVFL